MGEEPLADSPSEDFTSDVSENAETNNSLGKKQYSKNQERNQLKSKPQGTARTQDVQPAVDELLH